MQIEEKKLSVEIFPFESKVNLIGDSERYKLILINIIQNSVKFTFTGGIRIRFKMIPILDEWKNAICNHCGYLETTVSDSGIGID